MGQSRQSGGLRIDSFNAVTRSLIQDLERHFRAEETKPTDVDEAQKRGARPEPEPSASVPLLKTEQQTLLERHAIHRALGNMLRLPPYFESLKIDQIQLYLYLTHTVEAEAAPEAETFNVDARRWEELLSNDPTKIRAAVEAIQNEGQAEAYARRLSGARSDEKAFTLQQRVSALTAAGYLGDPRFRPDAWHLPDEPLLGFIAIPEGPFVMGSDPKHDGRAYEDEQPQHEVALPTYYIARYPVTVAQFQAFVSASGHKLGDEDSLRGVPNHPVVNVTWHDARAYCDWLIEALKKWQGTPDALVRLLRESNGRITLPSEAEWEKAARGGLPSPDQGEGAGVRVNARIYPWGDEFDPNKANVGETGIGATSAVGCFPAGASPYGVLDMSGNVWEWTRSLWGKDPQKPDFGYPYDPKDSRREDLKAPNDVRRVLRGGSWLNEASFARGAYRLRNSPVNRYFVSGFRCVLRSL